MEGPFVDTIKSILDEELIPVATTDVVYTPAKLVEKGEYFALMYKATSDGDVKLKIEIESSYKLPVTEGSADDYWAESTDDVVAALADENWHIKKIEPVAAKYIRVKITGLAAPSANDASTTLNLKLGILG